MISIGAFTMLVSIALALCTITPLLLLALAFNDYRKETLW
jgi:hypothetical protein